MINLYMPIKLIML